MIVNKIHSYYHKLTVVLLVLTELYIIVPTLLMYPDNHHGGYGFETYLLFAILLLMVLVDGFLSKRVFWMRLIVLLCFFVFLLVSNPLNINITYEEYIARGQPQWGEYVPQSEWHPDWREILEEEGELQAREGNKVK